MPSRRAEGQEMGFAKQTVSSTLKQQPEIVYEPRRVKARSPNRNEIPEGVHLTYGTPKQRDKEIVSFIFHHSVQVARLINLLRKAFDEHFQVHLLCSVFPYCYKIYCETPAYYALFEMEQWMK